MLTALQVACNLDTNHRLIGSRAAAAVQQSSDLLAVDPQKYLKVFNGFFELPSVRKAQPVEHQVGGVRVHPELVRKVQQPHQLVDGLGPALPQPAGCPELGLVQVELQRTVQPQSGRNYYNAYGQQCPLLLLTAVASDLPCAQSAL